MWIFDYTNQILPERNKKKILLVREKCENTEAKYCEEHILKLRWSRQYRSCITYRTAIPRAFTHLHSESKSQLLFLSPTYSRNTYLVFKTSGAGTSSWCFKYVVSPIKTIKVGRKYIEALGSKMLTLGLDRCSPFPFKTVGGLHSAEPGFSRKISHFLTT